MECCPRRCLALGGESKRLLWEQNRPSTGPKRYKAALKQVIGTPFTGALPESDELEIVQLVVAASQRLNDHSHPSEWKQDLSLEILVENLKSVLGTRVKIYLRSIAEQLLNPDNRLSWSQTNNNCRSFCRSLIDPELFGAFVNGPSSLEVSSMPLYVMSFVCPESDYPQNKAKTKLDVPKGLTEEYLLKFRFGRHDDADIIDSLQEYWYDWAALGGPLYRYQNLFPWDCTEAYGKYPTKCGNCNLAKHAWAFPFDTWSIIALHLTRDRHMYPPTRLAAVDANNEQPFSPQLWMQNRLLILQASCALTRGAVAMSKTSSFESATAWLHSDSNLRRGDSWLPQVKLGGIHRAQPSSHYFETGYYGNHFLASWARKPMADRIKEYEDQRNARANLVDVPPPRDYAVWMYERSHGFGPLNNNDFQRLNSVSTVDITDQNTMFTDAQFTDLDSKAASRSLCALGGVSNRPSGCGNV